MASGSNCCLDIVMDAPKDDGRESNLDESGVGVAGRSTSNMAAVETISQCMMSSGKNERDCAPKSRGAAVYGFHRIRASQVRSKSKGVNAPNKRYHRRRIDLLDCLLGVSEVQMI